MWAALTACFVLLLVVVLGAVVWAGANIVSFLQPILIPVAIAVILTYLLDPLVTKMSRGTLSRTKAVALLFAIAFLALGGFAAWLVPTISIQSANFARQVPAYTERARDYIVDLIYRFDETFGLFGAHGKSASTSFTNWLIGPASSPSPRAQATVTPTESPQGTPPATETIGPSAPKLTTAERQRIQAYVEKQMPKLEQALPTLMGKLWEILKKSIGGFLGITGFLLSLILRNQSLRHRIFSRPTAGLPGGWHSHRRCPHNFRSELCASDRRHGGRPDDDPLYWNNHLLGASSSHRRFSMGRLDAPDYCDANFYRYTKSRRHVLRPANCRKLCWIASDDGDRVDLSLGSDHWRSHRSPACRAAHRDSQGPPGTVRLGPTFEGTDCRIKRTSPGG